VRPVFLIASVCVLAAACAAPERAPGGWRVRELGTDAVFRDMFFTDANNGWIAGGGHNVDGGILGRTDDGGLTWRFRSGLVRTTKRQHLFHLNAVWFVDQRNGVVLGSGGVILRTIDGGDHWHEVRRGPRVSSHLFDVHFVDARHGWAVGNAGVIRTVDGGAQWTPASAPDAENGDPSGFGIHFLDRRHGIVVGSASRIHRTTDGGATWTRVSDRPTSGRPDLRAVHFPDRDHGWAVGENGAILHSADGGRTWSHQRSLTTVYLTDVRFVDGSRGWTIGFERDDGTSTVLYTADGGTTWERQFRVEREELHALFFADERHGWAVGTRVRPGTQKLLRYKVEPASERLALGQLE
jgi:photosystem II stability/assembly factor-like uncharacterized protein